MSTINKDIAKSYEKDVNIDKDNECDHEGEVKTLLLVRDLYGNKNKEKKSNACTQVNHFLKYHYKPKVTKNKLTNVNEITYDFLKEEEDFFELLATYFATEASIRCKKENGLLSLNSADGYFSAFKMHMIEKFESQKAEDLPCFGEKKWKKLREGIISIKIDYARNHGEKLINGQDMADEQEVISLASLCLWHGSERGIAFFAFNKMMYHLVTRCCESAGLWKKEIKVVKKTSRLLTNSILEFDLTRTKTKTSQQSVVYPHKNNFLWDLYFGLGLHFAVESDPKETLFPNFFKKLSKEKNLKKGDNHKSKATELWNQYHKELIDLSDKYKGKFL